MKLGCGAFTGPFPRALYLSFFSLTTLPVLSCSFVFFILFCSLSHFPPLSFQANENRRRNEKEKEQSGTDEQKASAKALKKKKKRLAKKKQAAADASKATEAGDEAEYSLILKKMLSSSSMDAGAPEAAGDLDRSHTAIDDGAETYFNGTANRSKLVSTLSNKRGSKKRRKNSNLAQDVSVSATSAALAKGAAPIPACSDTTLLLDSAACSNFARQNKQPSFASNKGSNFKPLSERTVTQKLTMLYENNLYSRWRFQLACHHSVMLIGYGSKKDLLDHFARTVLRPAGDVITIDGFSRDITIHQVLDAIVQCCLGGVNPNQNFLLPPGDCPPVRAPPSLGPRLPLDISHSRLLRRAAVISKEVSHLRTPHTRPVYLCVHNIDGAGLRTPDAQKALCVLSTASQGVFKLVATSDNVNAGAGLWDQATEQNFNWFWQDATTFDPYVAEVSQFAAAGKKKKGRAAGGGGALGGSGGGKSNAGGVGQVLKSLAPRHAELMKLLAREQIENGEREGGGGGEEEKGEGGGGGGGGGVTVVGMEYKAFKKEAQTRLLVTNDHALNLLLVELQEHALVTRKRTPDGADTISIPHPPDLVLMIRDWGK